MVTRKMKMNWFVAFNTMFMFLVIAVTLYPFIYMMAVSLSSDIYVLRGEVQFWPKGFTTKVYERVLQDSRIHSGYINTSIYVTVGTIISLMFTSMGAYALSRRDMIWRKGFAVLIVFTMLFNGGMIPTFLVVKELGLLDSIWAMVLPMAISAYNFFVMRTFFYNLPEELDEAGKIDGLNDLGVFFRIALPLSKPVMATIGLFYAVGIWNNFMLPLLYLRNADLYPLQMILRNIVFQGAFESNMSSSDDASIVPETLKYATIIVSTVPILCVYPFIQKYFVKGALLGSVKG